MGKKKRKPNHTLLYGQSQIYDDRTTTDLAIAGGVGSGKTYFACLWVHRNALEQPGETQWFCSHTDFLVKNVCFKTYTKLLKKWGYVKNAHYTTKADNYIKYSNGSEVFFLSAVAYERWVGASLVAAVLDEPGRYPDGAFNEIYERLRGPELANGAARQILYTGTPQGLTPYMDKFGGPDMEATGFNLQMAENGNSKTFELVKKSPDNRRKVLHFPCFLNDQIDREEQLAILYGQYGHDEQLVKAHVFGQFVPLFAHNCYSMSDKNVIDCAPNEAHYQLLISFDFNVGQMAFTCWQQIGGKSYCVAEAPNKCENTDQACNVIEDLFPPDIWTNHEIVILGDASGFARDTRSYVSDYDIIKQRLSKKYAKVIIAAPKANGSVRLRIQATNRALVANEHDGRPPLVYFDRECQRTITSMYQTVYDERGGIAKPSGDTITHPSDTVGYYIEYAHPFRHVGSLGVSY